MIRKLTTVSMAAALSAALVFGQGGYRRKDAGGGPPDPQTMIQRHVDSLATLLSLTDAQKTKATSIFTDAATASQAIRPNMQTARQSLNDAVKKNDTATIDTLASTIGTLTGQLTAIQSKAEAAFYATLTPDQQAKFDALPHGRPGGPGGPGGFGGPHGPMGPAGGGPGPQ